RRRGHELQDLARDARELMLLVEALGDVVGVAEQRLVRAAHELVIVEVALPVDGARLLLARQRVEEEQATGAAAADLLRAEVVAHGAVRMAARGTRRRDGMRMKGAAHDEAPRSRIHSQPASTAPASDTSAPRRRVA